IGRTRAAIDSVEKLHRPVARDHMLLADRCLGRMQAGLRLLHDDPEAFAAFRFANRAMAAQRKASVTVLAKRRGQPVPSTVEARWRPFQLGFILQCLCGLADLSNSDRELADLLWFPTG